MVKIDDAKFNDWLARWQKNIIGDARNRYCDKAMGEDIAWLMTPFTDGFYYGYMATRDPKWAQMLMDWTDSWLKRGVKEPDGLIGWPSPAAAGTKVDNLDDFNADSMLGETMASLARQCFWPPRSARTPRCEKSTPPRPTVTSRLPREFSRSGSSAAAGGKPRTAGASASCCPSASTARAASGPRAMPRATPPATASRTPTTRPISSPAGCWPCPTPPASRFTSNGPSAGSN